MMNAPAGWTRLMAMLLASTLMAGCACLNRFQADGELPLEGLTSTVTVNRDAQGMAYIRADSLADALTAQGFVTAQDRLFQMELTRRMAAGRIAEFVGQKATALDLQMRAIGCLRLARRQAQILSPDTRAFIQHYVDGINAYIATRDDTFPLEFKLAGFGPEPWEVADSLSVVYLLGWQTSANLKHEIVAQFLTEKLGWEKALEIFPLNIHQKDPGQPQRHGFESAAGKSPVFQHLSDDRRRVWAPSIAGALELGSNNWAVAATRTTSGKPIVANDPHLDARLLPGPFYPCGIFTPTLKAVGAGIPGVPGMVIFRNDQVAIGASNSYGDAQDLYVETLDPQDPSRYLEGERSLPFELSEEALEIKDKNAPGGMRHETVVLRHTRRGPVVSGLLPGLDTDRVITLRWAPAVSMEPLIGIERMLQARSVHEMREALSHVSIVMLNFIFADVGGNIGWQATGKLPVRSRGDGTLPLAVTSGEDNWHGWIPFDRMPGAINPAKGWLGACNHRTVDEDYPFYYSSYFAPSNRYRRLGELIESVPATTVEDHWRWQLDTLNVTARAVAPRIAACLAKYPETAETARILSDWDFHDDPARVAPTLYHATFLQLTRRILANAVGEAALETILDDPYLWQERIEQEVLSGDSPFFDDPATSVVESFEDVVLASALQAQSVLAETLGADRRKWLWGRVHRMEFLNPIRRSGFGARWLGGGSHPAPGSSATLCRGRYDFNRPYQVVVSAAMRVVFDLADPDKVTAVLAGGVSGRTFSPHQTDQIAPFLKGEKRYWWFNQKAVADHSVSALTLTPVERQNRRHGP